MVSAESIARDLAETRAFFRARSPCVSEEEYVRVARDTTVTELCDLQATPTWRCKQLAYAASGNVQGNWQAERTREETRAATTAAVEQAARALEREQARQLHEREQSERNSEHASFLRRQRANQGRAGQLEDELERMRDLQRRRERELVPASAASRSQHAPASVNSRVVAFLIQAVLYFLVDLIVKRVMDDNAVPTANGIIFLCITLVDFALAFSGRTLGYWLVGLQCIDESTRKPVGIERMLAWWLLHWPCLPVDLIVLLMSSRQRSLSQRYAAVIVVQQ